VLRFLRQIVIALRALFVALSGTTMAATQIGKDQVTSRSIEDGQVKTPDLEKRAVTKKKLANRSVTRAKIAGRVPDADALEGVGLADINRGRMATDPNCALSGEYTTCVGVELTVPVSQRLLVIGNGRISSNVTGTRNEYTECKVQVDNVDIGLSQAVGIGSSNLGSAFLFPEFSIALNGVTEPLDAGTHKAEFECRNTAGDNNVVFASQLSAVAISSG
jgi:hypothetical protein